MGKRPSESRSDSFDRRAFLRGAGLAAAAVPALNLTSGATAAPAARATVGCIKPRVDSKSVEELKPFLPADIRIVPVYLNLVEGTREEMQSTYPAYEQKIAALAAQHVDLITVEGAPPFLLAGPAAEKRMVDGWKTKYKTDMFTSSQNQVNVLNALKVKNVLGITSFGPDLNASYRKYFEDSGIRMVGMEGMDVPFGSISSTPQETIYNFITTKFREKRGADSIYILGSGMNALPLVARIEKDLGVPVVQPVAARAWEIQKRLHIHSPVKGYGKLLETLPGLAA